MRKLLCVALASLLTSLTSLQAGHVMMETSGKKQVTPPDDFPYIAGTKEVIISGAGFGSVGTLGDRERPDHGYAIGELKFGVMLTTPGGGGFLRGNLEFLGEAFGGGIFEGPGDQLYGGQVLLRYNFVQPQSRFVPFIQLGGGGVWSDAAYDDTTQRLIGSRWSFVLSAEVGGRIHLSRNVAIEAGFEYRHISNADTASRNRGLNSLGGELGVNFFF